MLKTVNFTVEHQHGLLSVPISGARYGWALDSDKNNVLQESYKLEIFCGNECVYSSGVCRSDKCVDLIPNITLKTGSFYKAMLSVTDNYGDTALAEEFFGTEILPEEWNGKFIRPKKHIQGWAPYIRKKFELGGNISRATLYACALGCGEFYINGHKISTDFIDPPMTNYEAEVFYRAFDVTEFLQSGGNCFAALIGDGFYSQNRVWSGSYNYKPNYGPVCLCAELRVEFEDGSTQIIATDDTWKYKYSPIILNNIYAGEVYDARLEIPDFADFDGDDDGWGSVIYDETPKGKLKGCNLAPVIIIRKIPAKSVKTVSGRDDGAWIFDMGENFAGIAEFHLPPSSVGSQYVFRFAETLNEKGVLDYRSTGAFATHCIEQETYIARGDANGEVWHPKFTYHGFRYIEVTGIRDTRVKYTIEPKTDFVVGLALSTDLKETGSFECDDEYIMRLQKVMLNTFRSNYHGLPEDCPAREKCGWLGDAHIVGDYAMMNYEMRPAYEKYVHDIRTTKEVYGTWKMISPGRRFCGEASPLWGGAQIILPYLMYKYYGDRYVIEKNFDMMELWVKHELDRSDDFIISDGLGDWGPPGRNKHPKRMPVNHSSTMIFFEICDKISALCKEFGYPNGEYYAGLAAKIKDSVIRHFYDAKNHTYGYWGSNGAALTLGIYPDGEREKLLKATVDLIKADDFEMHTGIYGTKYLVPVLCDDGYADIAYKFLFSKEHASYATMLDDSATSLWECIDMHFTEKEDVHVASYNHPMHAGFAYIYYSGIAGIKPLEPGFSRFAIAPDKFEKIRRVNAEYTTPHGKIAVKISRGDKETVYNLTIPVGTVCEFTAYTGEKNSLGSGKYTFTYAEN